MAVGPQWSKIPDSYNFLPETFNDRRGLNQCLLRFLHSHTQRPSKQCQMSALHYS